MTFVLLTCFRNLKIRKFYYPFYLFSFSFSPPWIVISSAFLLWKYVYVYHCFSFLFIIIPQPFLATCSWKWTLSLHSSAEKHVFPHFVALADVCVPADCEMWGSFGWPSGLVLSYSVSWQMYTCVNCMGEQVSPCVSGRKAGWCKVSGGVCLCLYPCTGVFWQKCVKQSKITCVHTHTHSLAHDQPLSVPQSNVWHSTCKWMGLLASWYS